MVHERTAIYKSQLEPIIENPGNTPGQNKFLVADSQTDYIGFTLSAMQASLVGA